MAMNSEKKHIFAKELTSKQRQSLKGMAHAIKPLVQIGAEGMSESVIKEIISTINSHELIKIQLASGTKASEKEEELVSLISKLPKHTHFVARIGRMVVLYLEKDPSDEPKIRLGKVGILN